MSQLSIHAADPDDIRTVAENMRVSDVTECEDLYRMGPFEALHASVRLCGGKASALRAGKRAIAIFGCYGLTLGNEGRPWLLGTPEIEQHPVAFLRTMRRVVDGYRATHSHLSNHVAADNEVSIRFLEHLGFRLSPSYTGKSRTRIRDFAMSGKDQ